MAGRLGPPLASDLRLVQSNYHRLSRVRDCRGRLRRSAGCDDRVRDLAAHQRCQGSSVAESGRSDHGGHAHLGACPRSLSEAGNQRFVSEIEGAQQRQSSHTGAPSCGSAPARTHEVRRGTAIEVAHAYQAGASAASPSCRDVHNSAGTPAGTAVLQLVPRQLGRWAKRQSVGHADIGINVDHAANDRPRGTAARAWSAGHAAPSPHGAHERRLVVLRRAPGRCDAAVDRQVRQCHGRERVHCLIG